MKRLTVSFFLFTLILNCLQGQSDTLKWKDKLKWNGYVRYMGSRTSSMMLPEDQYNHLIHNRINLKYKFNRKSQLRLELRNRAFFGTQLANGGYQYLADGLDADAGFVDMAFQLITDEHVLLNSTVDRLWYAVNKGSWELNIGRQRINWGINYLWNSNDVFNAYAFTDFDYTERPGSDAIRITRYMKKMRRWEVALKPNQDVEKGVYGAKYNWNKWNYDFQVIGGWMQENVFFGQGWAGNIKNFGFKGESNLFYHETEGVDLSFSAGLDYIFGNQTMLSAGYLLNTNFFNQDVSLLNGLPTSSLSAKNLMPVPHALYVQSTYPVNPLLSATMVAVVIPGAKGVFLMPSLSYSSSNNTEISMFMQLMEGQYQNEWQNLFNSVFLRGALNF